MNEFIQNRISSMIDRELSIDRKIREKFAEFFEVLPEDKRKNLSLSLETIQNENLKNLLGKILEEVNSKGISNQDDSALELFVEKRFDEITDFNISTLPENEQKEIKRNVDILEKIKNNIDKYKF